MPSDDQKLIFRYLSLCNSLAAIGMVGVIVKVIISREHSLTFSRLGETWRFKKKSLLIFVDIVKESLFPHNCLCNFCFWTSLHIRTMAKKRTPLNSNGRHAFIRELQKYPIQFLDKSVYTFLINLIFENDFFKICSFK